MRLTYRLYTDYIGIRVLDLFGRNVIPVMRKICAANAVAESTSRPAFREMADTLKWEDML